MSLVSKFNEQMINFQEELININIDRITKKKKTNFIKSFFLIRS